MPSLSRRRSFNRGSADQSLGSTSIGHVTAPSQQGYWYYFVFLCATLLKLVVVDTLETTPLFQTTTTGPLDRCTTEIRGSDDLPPARTCVSLAWRHIVGTASGALANVEGGQSEDQLSDPQNARKKIKQQSLRLAYRTLFRSRP
jgi:hypothetical protein